MFKVLPIIFLSLFLRPVFTVGQSNVFKPKFAYTIDASSFIYQCTRVIPEKIEKFWTPGKLDIENFQSKFKTLYLFESNVCCTEGEKISDLKQFSFQYIGIVQDNKRRIYINAFPEESVNVYKNSGYNLRKKPVGVCDGGKYYWGAVFDLESKKFIFLAFNDRG